MATGMTIRRPGGAIVIDSKFKTLGLSQKIPDVITAGTTPVGYNLTVAGENVLVAVFCSALEVCSYRATQGPTVTSIDFLFRGPGGTTSETVIFYVFANPTFGGQTYGLKIYDPPTGACIFSNFSKPIRIAAVVPGNSGFTGAGGRVYAPIMLTRYDDVTYNNGVIWNIRYSFLQSFGNSIAANMRTIKTGSIRRTAISGSYLAADVTGY